MVWPDVFPQPAPEGQPVKRLKHQIHGAKQEKLYPEEEGSQYKYKLKIPEGQVYVPRLEPTALIRLADRNHAHYPSRRCTILNLKRWLNDGLPAHMIPIHTGIIRRFNLHEVHLAHQIHGVA